MSSDVGHRHGSDPEWLWHRPAAVAPIHPLAWELPYATGVALKRKTKHQLVSMSIASSHPERISYLT